MYKVILSNNGVNYVIHSEKTDIKNAKLSSGKITQAINSISSFDFTILPNNIAFTHIFQFLSKIYVLNTKTGEFVFKGRVLNIDPKMDTKGAISKSVTCEDRLAYLCDSIQPYTKEQKWGTDEVSTGLYKYIAYLLDNHNRQVEEEKRIYPGIITGPTLTNDNSVDKGTNYETTFDCIKTKIVDDFGGEIQLREIEGKLFLDYVEKIGIEKRTKIEIGKNQKSLEKSAKFNNIFTRLIPLGAKLKVQDEHGNESDSEERLTIAEVNDGITWLDTNELNDLGVITKTAIFDNITDPTNLLRKAEEYIGENNKVTESYKVTTVDLSLIDSNFEEFDLGNAHEVKNRLLQIDKKLRIIKKVIDICKPTSSSFEVGDTTTTLSDITKEKTKDITAILQQITNITTNYVKNSTLSHSLTNVTSLINQKYNEITMLLKEEYVSNSDFSKSLERISKMEMLIDSISLLVSQVQSLCGFASGKGQLNFKNGSNTSLLYFAIEGFYNYRDLDDTFFLSRSKFISDKRYIAGYRQFKTMDSVTLCVDTSPKGSPSKNIRKYIIDLGGPLFSDGTKSDIFEIQLSETHELVGQIARYFELDEMNNRVELEEPIYKKIDPIVIDIFDGENYIYLEETDWYNLIVEYVTNDSKNNYWASYAQLKLTEKSILLETQTTYETKESAKSRIEMLAGSITLGVENSNNKTASITLSVNGKSQTGTIIMNGLVSFTDLSTSGKTTICGDNIKTGTIDANLVNVANINASNIKTGTLDANVISVINLNASNIKSGEIDADVINIKNINADNIRSGSLSCDRLDGGKISGQTIEGGSIDIGNSKYYLRMGDNWTKNPEVSGLNVGSRGIAMDDNGISNCSDVSNSRGDLYLASNSGTVHIGHSVSGSGRPIEVSKDKVYINQYLDVTTNSFYVRKVNGTQISLSSYINEASLRKLKTNIKSIEFDFIQNLYNEVKELSLYSFDYKKTYIQDNKERKNHYGFMIDDVEDKNIGKILEIERNNETALYSAKSLAKLDFFMIKELIRRMELQQQEINNLKKVVMKS